MMRDTKELLERIITNYGVKELEEIINYCKVERDLINTKYEVGDIVWIKRGMGKDNIAQIQYYMTENNGESCSYLVKSNNEDIPLGCADIRPATQEEKDVFNAGETWKEHEEEVWDEKSKKFDEWFKEVLAKAEKRAEESPEVEPHIAGFKRSDTVDNDDRIKRRQELTVQMAENRYNDRIYELKRKALVKSSDALDQPGDEEVIEKFKKLNQQATEEKIKELKKEAKKYDLKVEEFRNESRPFSKDN